MPGGPVNGAFIPGMMGMTPPDGSKNTGIIVPTVLQMAADALSYWTSMTCLYDRYWEPYPDKVTLPICMFHIKKIVPTYTVETSEKRVILYEPQQDEKMDTKKMADQMRRGVMQTITDNAVKKPVTYSAELIVPFQPIGRYVTEGAKTISDMVAAMSGLFGGSPHGESTDWLEGIFSSVFPLMKTAGQAAELAGKLPSMDGASFINMNSLEAMADSCRTLCMKMWTGYDYKYVMITGMSPDKQPTEDDVFRVSLTLKEIPVLAISRPKDPKPSTIDRNWAVTAISAAQGFFVSPLIWMTDVRGAAKGGKTGEEMISAMLGE